MHRCGSPIYGRSFPAGHMKASSYTALRIFPLSFLAMWQEQRENQQCHIPFESYAMSAFNPKRCWVDFGKRGSQMEPKGDAAINSERSFCLWKIWRQPQVNLGEAVQSRVSSCYSPCVSTCKFLDIRKLLFWVKSRAVLMWLWIN